MHDVEQEHSADQGRDNAGGQITAALAQRGLEFAADQTELLDRYRAALWRWNGRLNLTRHTTIEKFVGRDVVDSVELAKLVGPSRRVLDVGSGGGAPGVVMAICRPDLRMVLCESTQKKARALQSIVEELELPVEVFGCRAEELLALRSFDTLVARAVAPLARILYWLQPHWSAFDELLLIKGRSWVEERGEARRRGLLHSLELRRATTYGSPVVDESKTESIGESVILRITRKGASDE
ncbi:MAG: 16S rRNA (guanine(527)-N(7))-methyltransferase RsmG [Planctomycetota bacterium]